MWRPLEKDQYSNDLFHSRNSNVNNPFSRNSNRQQQQFGKLSRTTHVNRDQQLTALRITAGEAIKNRVNGEQKPSLPFTAMSSQEERRTEFGTPWSGLPWILKPILKDLGNLVEFRVGNFQTNVWRGGNWLNCI